MRVLEFLLPPFRFVAERIAVNRRMSRFTCADCAKNRYCGQPPDASCEYRQLAIENEGDRARPGPVTFVLN